MAREGATRALVVLWQVASAPPVLFRRRRRLVVKHIEIDKPVEDDLIAGELYFDQRLFARLSGDDRVNRSDASDPLPVSIGEILRLNRVRPHGDRFADENEGTMLHGGCS